jgi:hypothetical protein
VISEECGGYFPPHPGTRPLPDLPMPNEQQSYEVVCAGFGMDPYTFVQSNAVWLSGAAWYGCSSVTHWLTVTVCVEEFNNTYGWIEQGCEAEQRQGQQSVMGVVDVPCVNGGDPSIWTQRYRTRAMAEVVFPDGRAGYTGWSYGGTRFLPDC